MTQKFISDDIGVTLHRRDGRVDFERPRFIVVVEEEVDARGREVGGVLPRFVECESFVRGKAAEDAPPQRLARGVLQKMARDFCDSDCVMSCASCATSSCAAGSITSGDSNGRIGSLLAIGFEHVQAGGEGRFAELSRESRARTTSGRFCSQRSKSAVRARSITRARARIQHFRYSVSGTLMSGGWSRPAPRRSSSCTGRPTSAAASATILPK